MKFAVNREAILEGFQVAGSIIAARTIRPILGHVHLVVTDDNRAELMSTDLEISIRYTVPLESVEEIGEAVIPAQRATAILRECTSSTVRFEADATGKVKLSAGKSSFSLLTENLADFPEIPRFANERAFGLDRSKLVTLIRKTQFAVAKEKSRFAFNGAKLEISGDVARMIATDGKRLAMKEEAIDNSDGIAAGHIVPARALQIFEKIMTDEDDFVRITLSEHEIMVKCARAEVSSRLVEGRFPKDVLVSSFRQAALLTSQETRSVKFTLEDGKAVLRAQALDAGEATIEIDAPDYTGEPFTIAFNPEFMTEGLKVMDADQVTIGLSRPNQPARITGEENHVYVIMPVTMRSG